MSNVPLTTSASSTEAENARLRERIRNLEAELSRGSEQRRSTSRRDRDEDSFRDVATHAADEASRFLRGLTFAMVEQLRASAKVADAIADEVFTRQESEPASERSSSSSSRRYRARDRSYRSSYSRYESDERSYDDEDDRADNEGRRARRRTRNLANDVVSGVIEGLHQSVEVPRRVVSRFYEAYAEDDDSDGSESQDADTYRSERRYSSERESADEGRTRSVKVEKESGPSGESFKKEIKT